ncbi:MAG: Fic family protein [bacterium]|nr:Fic family protein [bacterium]
MLRGIEDNYAGKYRNVQVMIKGSSHVPPAHYLIAKQMEDFFIWYHDNRKNMHPVLLTAEMHMRLDSKHPFIDGNGRTSLLLMNLVLPQNGFVITNIKGDSKSRMVYFTALEKAKTKGKKDAFLKLVATYALGALQRLIKVLGS